MVGFNARQQAFIMRIIAQSICIPSVKDVAELYAKEMAELADDAGGV